MTSEEIRKIRELATQFAKANCMHILQQLHEDSEEDDSKYSGGNMVAAIEYFGVLFMAALREQSPSLMIPEKL